jgi:hypothetical protein
MLRLDFKEASNRIKAVDADLEVLLSAVWDQATKACQPDLCFFLAKYPYKHFVFKNGKALDPGNRPLESSLLVANRLPVGLILDNLLEVLDKEEIEFPEALLFKGELVGLWELIDDLQAVKSRPTPKSTISSGSRSLKFLEFPTQETKWKRLRAKYKHLSTYDKEFAKLREIELIEMISDLDRKSKEWVTQVLYFSSSWFEELRRQLKLTDQERDVHATRLFSHLTGKAWSALARVRDYDDQLNDALTDWGKDSDVARCRAARLLLTQSLEVVDRRRPCFGLADGHHPNLGPLNTLKEELLHVARLNQAILGPTYLDAGRAGFLSLSQLVPSAFDESPEDSLEKIFKIIWRARNEAIKRNLAIPAFDRLPELFSRLTFRVRTGRQRQKGRHGSVSTFKVDGSQSVGGTFPRESIPIEAFYDPIFSANNLPPSDSRFFRVAIKLDLRESIHIPEY